MSRLFPSRPVVSALALLLAAAWCSAEEWKVRADFEGGSARVESVDQAGHVIRLTPGGDPQRGWPCWWFARIDGVEANEHLTVSVGGSDRPSRDNGKETGKPLAPGWALPRKAAFSIDGKTWQQTGLGKREGARMSYELTGTGGPLWIAWGPPFTANDAAVFVTQLEAKAGASAKRLDLGPTREGRAVPGVRIGAAGKPVVWVHARAHAWESGGSWVARGLGEWAVSDAPAAKWLRENAEVILVPVLDIDNVVTGDGGKEAAPRDHNRDWDDAPVHPEVKAAQELLLGLAKEKRLELFLDLHNPAPSDANPFFFTGPDDLLTERGKTNRETFLKLARARIIDPLKVEEKTRVTGPGYHPLWKNLAGIWVNLHTGGEAVAVCLETAWNTPVSGVEGYRAVGRQLGESVAEYLKALQSPSPN